MFKDKKAREAIEALMTLVGAVPKIDWEADKTVAGDRKLADEFRFLNSKIDLILNHLNLTYIPETEKKEAARLETKPELSYFADLKHGSIVTTSKIGEFSGFGMYKDGSELFNTASGTKKKKRGRPKKK